ncbi:MAG: hypothetical protein Q8N46_03640 [Anaerolineales bacterium]|nr:hypothetical protein [Anaerolineales bacterium]
MKKLNFLFVLTLLLAACGPAPTGETISGCRATVDAMSALTGGLEFPANFQTENPVKTGSEFDVMQYFSVLDHLSMQPGYVLDYIYHYDGMGGYPVLYVRPAGQPPYATEADLTAGGDRTSTLDYIQTDDTPESYFQFVVLAKMGSQFYLFWHANYSDSQIVCDKADVTSILASLNGDFGYRISLAARVRAALLKDVGPSVKVGEQTVEVRFVTFTRWGGFYQETYTLSRSMPHTIQDVQEKNLVPYECGVMF